MITVAAFMDGLRADIARLVAKNSLLHTRIASSELFLAPIAERGTGYTIIVELAPGGPRQKVRII